jgi:uncharacterized protein (TIGR02246 family)
MRISSGFHLVLLLLLIGIPALCEAEDGKDAEEAVEQTLANYRAAWLEGDQQKVLDSLSEEVQLFVPGSSVGKLDGKEAVSEFWFPPSDLSYPINGYEISGQEIYVQGDLAIVTGKSKLDWDTVEGGRVTRQATSHSEYLSVLRKEDGKWRIFRQMYQMREQGSGSE